MEYKNIDRIGNLKFIPQHAAIGKGETGFVIVKMMMNTRTGRNEVTLWKATGLIGSAENNADFQRAFQIAKDKLERGHFACR